MVAAFEKAAAEAKTIEEVVSAGAELRSLISADRLALALRTRVENAGLDAIRRLKPAKPKKEAAKEADPAADPDYQRGLRDARDGVRACLSTEIKADEARFAAWRAGFYAGQKAEG